MAAIPVSARACHLGWSLGSRFSTSYAERSDFSGTGCEVLFKGRGVIESGEFFILERRKRWLGVAVAEASSSDSSSGSVRAGASNGRAEISRISSGSKVGARERRLQKQDEKRRSEIPTQEQYPEWASILENAVKDDVELREIIGDSLGNPEEMRKRVEERVKKKGRNVLSPLTGSSVPMTVVFKADFDATDANVWLELYASPSEKDLDTIGSVLRSWYLLGRLGAFNSMNMQLTELPIDARLSYSTDKAGEALPSLFHNIGDLEFQDNWGRFWVDFGTSDPVAMDVLINALTAVSSEHVGIKQLIFGGEKLGDWDEGMVDPKDGYRCYKI
ncbi:hypothetical protein R1flu_027000 [Riccia fluitans]|uniref:Uncharacterized protein n=1 Tax=Riccia fluitans TaxID=41844 RepID=A0ABD1XHJ6_9MARC